jgi:glycosyltransferase involved in cell wall biosynthesis
MPRSTAPSRESDTQIQPDTSLLIEGWRGVSHSYALVNQYQILELLKIGGLKLFHHDLPFFNKDWNRTRNDANFPLDDQQKIDALPPAGDTRIDCMYRIAFPVPAGAINDQRRTVTFMITELGLADSHFAVAPDRYSFFTRGDNSIVTSSRWSRDRIVEFGFPAEKVQVVPCGVDTAIFRPLSPDERRLNRANLGIREDETVFVNVGGAYWNKGVDLLLRAFANLRNQGRKVRLIVKDQRGLYGVPVEQTVRNVGKDQPTLLHPDTLAAISVIPGNLSRMELRTLYGIADAYVSPYRAEGFNLPVLEAIACGTPVIVTQGGATDDFCPEDLAFHIPGQLRSTDNQTHGIAGRYIEPDLDALISAMEDFVSGRRRDAGGFAAARANVLKAFSWQQAAHGLAQLVTGCAMPQSPAMPAATSEQAAPALPRRIRQEDVLDLIKIIRPWSMSDMLKVRIGNEYDGGYVLPAVALDCDGVLSIGVGTDVSFDLQLAEQGAHVLQFDHTVEHSPTAHANFRFHKLGWGSRSEGSYLSFADICAKLTPLAIKRPLFKFDIEGAEYDVFDTLDPKMLEQFEVIACEIHDLAKLADPFFFDKARRVLEKLTAHHVPVHLHANNYAGVALVQGVPMPEVLELSFLRRELDSFPYVSTGAIPGQLDRPNNPYLPDICMNPF